MIINFPSILFDRRAKRSRIVPTINKIIPPPPFESGKRYPQNVSINSNFTVDESFEARNVGFALSSETGCFSSRLRDERWNAMHLSWRRCFPETWGKHLSFPTPTGRARSLKLEKRRGRGGGGGASEPKRFTREEWGFERNDGIHIFPPTKRTTAFWEILRRWRIVHHRCGPPQKEGMREEEENESEMNLVGSSPLFDRSRSPLRVEEGLGLVSVWPSYESARSSKGELLFRASVSHERKKRKRRGESFRVIIVYGFVFIGMCFEIKKEGRGEKENF